jgi:iron(III) transport system permease protein
MIRGGQFARVVFVCLGALPVIVFIGWPIGAVLVRGFVVSGPMPEWRLKEVTVAALDLLEEERRAAALARWSTPRDDRERAEALAAAFRLAGRAPPWDTAAMFQAQIAAANAALAALPEADRAAVEAELPIATVMLHRRVALAFAVRDRLAAAEFDALRTAAETRIGLDHYLAAFEDSHLRRAALNSLGLATLAACTTTPLASALAFAVNRRAVRRPALVRTLVLLPLVAPPVLVATAIVMLAGRRGLLTDALLERGLGLIDADLVNIYGLAGVVLAQILSFVPPAFIVLDNTLRRADGRLEEAAAGLGASPARVFREVTLALAWPGFKRALVLVFVSSLTDFGSPLLLAGRELPVLAAVVYDEMTAFQNAELASALAVLLLVPGLLLHLGLERIGGRRRFDTTPGPPPEAPLPRSWRRGLAALAALVGSAVAAIYGTIVLGSLTRVWGADWSLTLVHFTPAGLGGAIAGPGAAPIEQGLDLVPQSLLAAGTAAPMGGLAGLWLAFLVERLRPPGREALAFLVLLPAILPGLIFGIGYILAFNLPFGIAAFSLTGTLAILVLNIAFGNLFVGFLAARATLARIDPAIEEAAEIAGAGVLRRLGSVVMPMLRPALLLGTLYVFVDGMTTLSSVIFLVSGTHKLASVAIFNDANGGDYGRACATSVAILACAGAAMLGIWLLERRDRVRLGGIR